MKNKRAALATSTLIILITVILIVSFVIFGIFNYLDFFSGTGYANNRFTEQYISTGVEITSIEGADGRNRYFDEYYVNIKAIPNSESIAFEDMDLLIKTKYSNALLSYRNGTPTPSNDGYVTYSTDYFLDSSADYAFFQPVLLQINPGSFTPIAVDIDGDGVNDEVGTCDGTLCPPIYDDVAIVFNLSSAGLQYSYLNDTTNNLVDISGGGLIPLDIDYSYIGSESDPYGFVTTYDTKPAFLAHTLVADATTGPFFVYTSPIQLSNDLDGDGNREWAVLNDTHLRIFPTIERVSIDVPLGVDISGAPATINVAQDLALSNGTVIGSLVIDGTGQNGVVEEEAIQVTPLLSEVGFYQIEYLIPPSNPFLSDSISRGETVRIYVDSPYRMGPNDEISFNFITPKGVTFPITAFTGHTIIGNRLISLYPKT